MPGISTPGDATITINPPKRTGSNPCDDLEHSWCHVSQSEQERLAHPNVRKEYSLPLYLMPPQFFADHKAFLDRHGLQPGAKSERRGDPCPQPMTESHTDVRHSQHSQGPSPGHASVTSGTALNLDGTSNMPHYPPPNYPLSSKLPLRPGAVRTSQPPTDDQPSEQHPPPVTTPDHRRDDRKSSHDGSTTTVKPKFALRPTAQSYYPPAPRPRYPPSLQIQTYFQWFWGPAIFPPISAWSGEPLNICLSPASISSATTTTEKSRPEPNDPKSPPTVTTPPHTSSDPTAWSTLWDSPFEPGTFALWSSMSVLTDSNARPRHVDYRGLWAEFVARTGKTRLGFDGAGGGERGGMEIECPRPVSPKKARLVDGLTRSGDGVELGGGEPMDEKEKGVVVPVDRGKTRKAKKKNKQPKTRRRGRTERREKLRRMQGNWREHR